MKREAGARHTRDRPIHHHLYHPLCGSSTDAQDHRAIVVVNIIRSHATESNKSTQAPLMSISRIIKGSCVGTVQISLSGITEEKDC